MRRKIVAENATIKEFMKEFYLIFRNRKLTADDVERIADRVARRGLDITPQYFEPQSIADYLEFVKMLEARYVLHQLIEEDYSCVAVHRKELGDCENVYYYIFTEEDNDGFAWCLKVDEYNCPCCFELCKVDEIKELPKQEEKSIYELAYEIGVYWREK